MYCSQVYSGLIYAAQGGHLEIVKSLLEAGVDLDKEVSNYMIIITFSVTYFILLVYILKYIYNHTLFLTIFIKYESEQ